MSTSPRAGYDADAFIAARDPELHARLEQLRVLNSQLVETVSEMDAASMAYHAGYASLEAFLVVTCQLSYRHARQLVSEARHLRETTDRASPIGVGRTGQ